MALAGGVLDQHDLAGADVADAARRHDAVHGDHLEPGADQAQPAGRHGAGEAGTAGALPAIVNAVIDALAPLGVKDLDMPATSERIWQAIRNTRA